MLTSLVFVRLLLFVTVAGGVGAGMALSRHSHKVLASLLLGVGTGLLWRHSWHMVRRHSPGVLEQAQRNMEEAQEMLRNSFQFRLGFDRPGLPPPSLLRLEEILSDTITMVLAISLAATAWVLPVFWFESDPGVRGMARTAAAHLFALLCVATATFGLIARIVGRRGGSL
jgi:hypothetical protein